MQYQPTAIWITDPRNGERSQVGALASTPVREREPLSGDGAECTDRERLPEMMGGVAVAGKGLQQRSVLPTLPPPLRSLWFMAKAWHAANL
jgi:hypothetical protein